MSTEKKILTLEIANKLLSESSYNYDEFDEIDMDAEKVLTEHKIHFSFLASLSEAEANALSQKEGYLFLNGLTTLSDGAAEEFSDHQGRLSFPKKPYCLMLLQYC
jgi:hypothetical protein